MKIIFNDGSEHIIEEKYQKLVRGFCNLDRLTSDKPAPTRYMKPKCDRDRVFNFVKCEAWADGDDKWVECFLLGVIADSGNLFVVVSIGAYNSYDWSSKKCRIPEFSVKSPPPVDTPAMTKEYGIRHFKCYSMEGNPIFYPKGTTSISYDNKLTCAWSINTDTEWVDFPKSDYEWMEE